MENEKVVVDTDAAKPDQENAQTDEESLDDLLNEYSGEYDKGTKPSDTEDKAKPLEDNIESRLVKLERNEINTEIDSAADVFIDSLGEMPLKVTRGLARAHLSDLASRDDRFMDAFSNRKSNPQAFNKVLKAAGKKFKEDLAPIDQQTTNDIESVVTSIKGKQPPGDDAPNFAAMTDQEYEQWKQKQR